MTLLDFEAPAGVYDSKGNSAMAHMVEKMPNVAYAALSQFYIDDKALRRKYYYLNQLESCRDEKEMGQNHAKTALEVEPFLFLNIFAIFHKFTNAQAHKSSFIPRASQLWNSLPPTAFPESYNLSSFKCNVNKLDLVSLST